MSMQASFFLNFFKTKKFCRAVAMTNVTQAGFLKFFLRRKNVVQAWR